MATEAAPRELIARRAFPARLGPKGNLLYKLITTTDHKLIGIMYVVTCFAFFFTGGLMALLMRAELSAPGRPHRRWPVGTRQPRCEVGHQVPPPRHNFTELARIRSERPAFELHYPHMVERMRNELYIGREAVVGAGEKHEKTPTHGSGGHFGAVALTHPHALWICVPLKPVAAIRRSEFRRPECPVRSGFWGDEDNPVFDDKRRRTDTEW